MKETRKTCITGKLPPPVGTSEWEVFSQDSFCVDKTRMIKELVDRVTTVALFTRPRRFGKTTALKMIRAFFEKRTDGKGRKVDTSYLKVYTVFDAAFGDSFGFTEAEVADMAAYNGVPEKMTEIKAWYDGYDFGGTEIYNPWSVLNCFSSDCKPGPYWLDTSSNDLITEIVSTYPHDTAKTLEGLLKGENPLQGVSNGRQTR